MASAYSIILVISVVLGIYTAVHQYSLFDHVVTTLAFIGISIPSFWLGLLLLIFFAVQTRNLGLPYFPAGGMYDLAVGPTVAAGALAPGPTVDHAGDGDHGRLHPLRARLDARGDPPGLHPHRARQGPLRAADRCAATPSRTRAIPLVTLIGLDLPRFLSGAIVVESIFAWPGHGPPVLGARREDGHPGPDGGVCCSRRCWWCSATCSPMSATPISTRGSGTDDGADLPMTRRAVTASGRRPSRGRAGAEHGRSTQAARAGSRRVPRHRLALLGVGDARLIGGDLRHRPAAGARIGRQSRRPDRCSARRLARRTRSAAMTSGATSSGGRSTAGGSR